MPINKNLPSHDPNALGEVMPVRFYHEPIQLVLGFLDNHIRPPQITNTIHDPICREFKLFGYSLKDLMRREAKIAAKYILRGEEGDVQNLLMMINENPILLDIEVEAEDCLNRKVKGKLLQIAAMAGDFNLKQNIQHEIYCGLVEKLIEAGKLSKEEVTDQLQCLNSKEAGQANDQRNRHFIRAIKKFGDGIINTEVNDMTLEEYQAHCKPLIDQFEKDLQMDVGVITKGYIFDLRILIAAAIYFENRAASFGGRKSEVFWINGFGKLQKMLSSRDAQVINVGFSRLDDHYRINYSRTFKREIALDDNELGISYWLGNHGLPCLSYPGNISSGYQKLFKNKEDSLEELILKPDPGPLCVIS